MLGNGRFKMNQNRYDGRSRLFERAPDGDRLNSETGLIKTFVWLWVIWGLFWLVVTGTLVWAVIHFLIKYW